MLPITDDLAHAKLTCEYLMKMFFFPMDRMRTDAWMRVLKAKKGDFRAWWEGTANPSPEQARYLANCWRQPIVYYYYVPESRDTFCWDEDDGRIIDVEAF